MQQHSSQGNGGRRQRTGAAHDQAGEMDGLLAELRRVLERIAVVGPPETVTVPLALPMELAELMVVQAQRMGVETPHIYTSCLLHGEYHSALENGLNDVARDIARMIRRSAPPREWERFCAQHPEAKEGL